MCDEENNQEYEQEQDIGYNDSEDVIPDHDSSSYVERGLNEDNIIRK